MESCCEVGRGGWDGTDDSMEARMRGIRRWRLVGFLGYNVHLTNKLVNF